MTSNRIRVLVADDHPMIRAGVAATIAAEPDMELTAAASNGAEAVALFRAHQPDIVLMDLRMPVMDGVEAIRVILQIAPAARIIVFIDLSGG